MPQPGADPQPRPCKSSAPGSDTESGCWVQLRRGHLAVLQLSVMNFRLFIVRLSVCVLFGVMFSSDEW